MSPVAQTRWVTFGCNGTLVEPTGTRNAGEAFCQTESVRLFGDVEAMLAELRSQGFRLAVLTNCHDRVFEAIHRRFAKPFDLFVTAERVRGYKPCRWHFRAFELLTRVARRDWVHVGCSVYHDVAPAEALGIKGVWLDRHRTGERPLGASPHVRTTTDAVDAVLTLFEMQDAKRKMQKAFAF